MWVSISISIYRQMKVPSGPAFLAHILPPSVIRENCLYSVNHFNKTLIGQAGSIGGSTRQEVEAGR